MMQLGTAANSDLSGVPRYSIKLSMPLQTYLITFKIILKMVHLNLHGLFFLDKISAPSASYTDKILVFLTTVDSSKKSSNYSTGYGVSYSITLFLQFGKFHNVGYTAFNQHLFTRQLSSSKVPNLWCMLFRIINGGFSIVIKTHRSVTS